MNASFLQSYAPLLIHVLAAMGVSGAILLASGLVGWRRPNRAKQEPYECGMHPSGDAREPFSVKFYLVAMLFIIFDIEIVFLYPWAVVFRHLGAFGLLEMGLFVAVLLVGLVYAWKKGGLEWD